MVTGVNVIGIYVTNFKRSMDFYTKILGLKDLGENGPGHMLDAGNMSIYLEESRKSTKIDAMSRADITVCFAADSVKSAYEKLLKKDVIITMEYEEYSPEFAMFIISDPDGNILEFAGNP